LSGKKVFITGASGLLGANLIEKLLAQNSKISQVYALVREKERSFDRLEKLNVEIIKGDITEDKWAKNISDMDIIYHLAAKINVPSAIENPLETYKINVNGTINLLEAIKKYNDNAKLVYCSSANVYGQPKYLPINENHSLFPLEPYGASKAAAEMICSAYHNAYNINYVCIRPFYIYGPGQENTQFVPRIILNILNNKPVIKGKKDVVRDFVYVKDVSNALIIAAEKGKNGEIYNIASGKQTKINDAIDEIIKIFGDKKVKIEFQDLRPGSIEISNISVDITKAKEELGWQPEYSLQKGLEETVNWFKNRGN